MSLWKKVTSFLFEETEADIIAEDDLEAISLKEKVYEFTPVISPIFGAKEENA